MKKLFTFVLLTAVLTFVMTGCDREKKSTSAKIIIKATDLDSAHIKISFYTMFNFKQSTLDSAGHSVLEFKLTEPVFALLEVGTKMGALYLAPGYDMRVSVSGQGQEKPFHYTGEGSEASNYLGYVFVLHNKFNTSGGKYIMNLEPEEFLARFDSLENAYADFYQHYTDSVEVPEQVKTLLEAKNKLNLFNIKQDYAFAHWKSALPPALRNIADEVPFDTTLLNDGLVEYSIVMDKYLDTKFYLPDWENKTPEEIRTSNEHLPLTVDTEIRKGDYPAAIREFVRAKNINHWLVSGGITPAVDTIMTRFKKEYHASAYTPLLEEVYAKWAAILPGNPAPDFTGTTPEGKKLSLSDLKGKIVYVDVWATWCGPCRGEVPYSKKLQKKFNDDDRVAFLYVSIDNNEEDWKKVLSEDTEFKGIHILHQPQEAEVSMLGIYMITGIPRYVLIDQEGKIVQADASRPSSGKVAGEIEELLNKKKTGML